MGAHGHMQPTSAKPQAAQTFTGRRGKYSGKANHNGNLIAWTGTNKALSSTTHCGGWGVCLWVRWPHRHWLIPHPLHRIHNKLPTSFAETRERQCIPGYGTPSQEDTGSHREAELRNTLSHQIVKSPLGTHSNQGPWFTKPHQASIPKGQSAQVNYRPLYTFHSKCLSLRNSSSNN